jgi:hypothetical protein
MPTWKQALREGLVSGSLASVFSAAYLAWAGHRRGQTAGPVNAVSHWIFGNRALREDEPSVAHTLTGYLIHHAAALFWGVLYAKAWSARDAAKKPIPAVAGAVTAAGVACFVDYQLTPKRLTPGFEHRLGRPELANVYAFFALGLAVGTLVMKKRR